MKVGLNALRIFKAREVSLDMRAKYPSTYRHDIDESCQFNPNINYLYFPPDLHTPDIPKKKPKPKPKSTSPFYCFSLIPDTTIEGKHSLDKTLYFMQFLNWAIYYYHTLKVAYDAIPKDPKQEELLESTDTARAIETFMHSLTGREYTKEEANQNIQDTFKRNHFALKPASFLKLCRFFARAWYEEWFSPPDEAFGSVAFGYYVGNYIENDPAKCTYYNGNSNYHKKEVAKLFEDSATLSYQFNDFNIAIEKHPNTSETSSEKSSYSMSISQFGCKHTFYLFARLYHHRYSSNLSPSSSS